MRTHHLIRLALVHLLMGYSHTAISQTLGNVPANSSAPTPLKNCLQDSERQKLRSEELQKIVSEDQSDRLARPVDWNKVYPRDVIRIKRVGEIFAEGCIITGKDYAAAALVFQHGDHPDHYLQTYLWQKRAIELGNTSDHPDLMLAAIDRYLVSIDHKQLFATQYGKSGADGCRCLQPIEDRFSDKRRLQKGGKTIQEALKLVYEGNEGRPSCKSVTFCESKLKPTNKAVLPFTGIW